jgi:hypothetical protein
MTVNRTVARQLLYDFMFESNDAQNWVEDVWGLSPFLGQSCANAAEVLGALIATCSDQQLNAVLASLYAVHKTTIDELPSAQEWRVAIPFETAAVLDESAPDAGN